MGIQVSDRETPDAEGLSPAGVGIILLNLEAVLFTKITHNINLTT